MNRSTSKNILHCPIKECPNTNMEVPEVINHTLIRNYQAFVKYGCYNFNGLKDRKK